MYDYSAIDTIERIFAGGFGDLPNFYFLEAYSDGIQEEREGLVLFLEIIESELDPRDVGNVSLSRSAYLVRIDDSGMTTILNQTNSYIHHTYAQKHQKCHKYISYALMHHTFKDK